MAERAFAELRGPVRVLDPACGDGALLLATWRVGRTAGHATELFGIEVDPELAEAARTKLRRRIPGEEGHRAADHVVTGDALSGAWPADTRVVANPPWVSFSGPRAAARRGPAPSTTGEPGGWPSLHGAFLERIARHVGEEGTRAVVLMPASVCELDGYGPLRRAVRSHAALASPPVELGERAFPGVTEPAVLLELVPRPAAGPGSPAPWARSTARERELLALLSPFPRLPPETFSDPGVHTGNSARHLIVRPRGDRPGLREGRDLGPYSLGPPRLGLVIDLQRGPDRRFRIGPPERYAGISVLVRQTADRPVAALHFDPGYFRNSILACTPPAGLDPAFLVGVLNSSVAAAWHRLSFGDARQRAFPQVKVGHLRTQPVPISNRSQEPELHDRVAALVRAAQAAGGPDAEGRAEIDRVVMEAYRLPPDAARELRRRGASTSRSARRSPFAPSS